MPYQKVGAADLFYCVGFCNQTKWSECIFYPDLYVNFDVKYINWKWCDFIFEIKTNNSQCTIWQYEFLNANDAATTS